MATPTCQGATGPPPSGAWRKTRREPLARCCRLRQSRSPHFSGRFASMVLVRSMSSPWSPAKRPRLAPRAVDTARIQDHCQKPLPTTDQRNAALASKQPLVRPPLRRVQQHLHCLLLFLFPMRACVILLFGASPANSSTP